MEENYNPQNVSFFFQLSRLQKEERPPLLTVFP